MKQKLMKMALIVAAVFIGMTVIFGVYFYGNIEEAQSVLQLYMPTVESVTGDDGSISLFALARNNLFACAMCVGLGLIPFLFLPVWAIFSNSMIIGALLGMAAHAGSPASLVKMIVAGLLPHGLFELPAFFLSMAMGIYLCRLLSLKLFRKARDEKILPVLNGIAKGFVLIVMPLLVTAAVVECFLTPYLIQAAGIH